jgi:ectoine hydroxylase-related dioxygenase (phytanoyl-CoA dioxygenase family)
VTLPRLPADAKADDVLAALDEQGCAVVEDVLSPAEVDALVAELERLLTATPTGRNAFEGFQTQRVYNLFGKSRAYDGVALHPLMRGVLDGLLAHYQLSAPVGLSIGPGEVAQVLHYDDAVYPLPWPHQPVVLNSMWPLCDYTEANGATRLIPGSHTWDRDRQPSVDETIGAEMSPGSVLVYTGALWHSGGANGTDRPRPGILMEYVASWLRPQETHLLGVAPEVVATLPTELQDLLGYNVFPPFLGYVDGRHPKRTLSLQPERPASPPGSLGQGPT